MSENRLAGRANPVKKDFKQALPVVHGERQFPITTWGLLAGRYFLLDILRARMDYSTLKRSVIAQRVKWRADHVVIEYSSNGLSLVQQLRAEGPFHPVAWPPPGMKQLDKAERLLAQTGQIEEDRVFLPASLDGLDAFLSELRAFPNGRYDDPDARVVVFTLAQTEGRAERERPTHCSGPRQAATAAAAA